MSQQPPSPPSQDTLLKFPCSFPIKIMGKRTPHFAQTITSLVLEHAADFNPATVQMRTSKAANYLSLTCTINATSKQQLDDLYRALSSHPEVSVVL
jgi:putative lipoic acid-binding regulatory protein